METIEEINKHSLLDQIATATSSRAIGCGDNRLATIRGFQAVFKQLCRTPAIVRMLLHKEYDFMGQIDASMNLPDEDGILKRDWFSSTFVVPNYSRMVDWSAKMAHEYDNGRTVVAIIPSRTNTNWFHENVLPKATEIRFIKGRLMFPGFSRQSPFPDMIVIYDASKPKDGSITDDSPLDSAVGMDMTNRKPAKLAIIASVTGQSSVRTIDISDNEEEDEDTTTSSDTDGTVVAVDIDDHESKEEAMQIDNDEGKKGKEKRTKTSKHTGPPKRVPFGAGENNNARSTQQGIYYTRLRKRIKKDTE